MRTRTIESTVLSTTSRIQPVLLTSLMLALSAGLAWAAGTGALVEGNTAFSFDLYAQLKVKPGNLFFSPYSISTCLAMTYAGARGDTEKQMAEVLHFSQKQDQFHTSFGDLQRQLNQAGLGKGVELSIANALWEQKGLPFLPAFLKIGTSRYDAKLNQADFQTGADSAIREINRWVADKTKGRIQDILSPDSVSDPTRLVLANAVYFKGTWLKTFDKRNTAPRPFYLARGRETVVPLMFHTDRVWYVEDDAFQAVELPYAGNELSMVILLPRQIEGCSELEQSLNARNLANWIKRMMPKEVDLFIPKFKAESSFDLGPILAAMGMRESFAESADFSGMDGTRDLFISRIAHKAWVEVAEEGTEAAAATFAAAMEKSIQHKEPPRLTFRADHPFVFLIRHVPSGSILFIGRLADPTQ